MLEVWLASFRSRSSKFCLKTLTKVYHRFVLLTVVLASFRDLSYLSVSPCSYSDPQRPSIWDNPSLIPYFTMVVFLSLCQLTSGYSKYVLCIQLIMFWIHKICFYLREEKNKHLEKSGICRQWSVKETALLSSLF